MRKMKMDGMYKEKSGDDEKRMKTDYYNRSTENRNEYDKGMKFGNDFKKGMTESGSLGSKCTPRNKLGPGGAGAAVQKGPPGGPGGKGGHGDHGGKGGPQCG